MSGTIHSDEADTSESTVRGLLAAQCPQWSDLALTYLQNSGTSNAMWRLEVPGQTDVAVRLPRTEGADESVAKELTLLPELAKTNLADAFALPRVLHSGTPTNGFPYRWSVLDWIDGDDAWSARHKLIETDETFAADLARAVDIIHSQQHLSAPNRRRGERGGPLLDLLAQLDEWLDDPRWSARDFVDVKAVRRLAAESAEAAQDPIETTFVHGDLIPGNLLTTGRRLTAIIDWGGAGYADPAQDLGAAWAVLEGRAFSLFKETVDADDAAWLRARAFELEHAVGGIVYYKPLGHPLADVMARTLSRILDD